MLNKDDLYYLLNLLGYNFTPESTYSLDIEDNLKLLTDLLGD